MGPSYKWNKREADRRSSVGVGFDGSWGRLKGAAMVRSNQWCLVNGIWVVVEGVFWFWKELWGRARGDDGW